MTVLPTFHVDKCIVFDLECYPNHWGIGFLGLDRAGAISTRIVETKYLLEQILNSFAQQGRALVSYNGIRFDAPLIRAILKGLDPYPLAQQIIQDNRLPPALRSDRLPKFPCDHIDISERVRRGKLPPSLKLVAARMGRPVLRELPYKPEQSLTDDEWANVKLYNQVDLGHTRALLEQLAPELQALTSISNEFGQDLRNVTTPRIVERIFEAEYARVHGCAPVKHEPGEHVLYRPVPGVMRPRQRQAAAWFDALTQPIPLVLDSDRLVPQVPKLEYTSKGLKLKAGAGGLHSKDKPGVWYANKKELIVAADVASYYPTLIARKGITPQSYGSTGSALYKQILDSRLAIKDAVRNTEDANLRAQLKVQAEGLKLVLNAYSGKTKSPWSTLYDPAAYLSVTLSGQLMLIDLIEQLQIAKIHVITANTDGLYLRLERSRLADFQAVIARWQAATEMTLEVDQSISRLAISASNHYATIDRRGQIKRKGGLRGDLDWSHSPNWLVVNDAVAFALLTDVPPEKTIFDCQDMVRFCAITKRDGKAVHMTLSDTAAELPKVTRFYRQKDSTRQIQVDLESGKHTTPAGAKGVAICQDLPQHGRLSDVDLAWYLGAARKKIQQVRRYHHRSPSKLQGDPRDSSAFARALAGAQARQGSTGRLECPAPYFPLGMVQLSNDRLLHRAGLRHAGDRCRCPREVRPILVLAETPRGHAGVVARFFQRGGSAGRSRSRQTDLPVPSRGRSSALQKRCENSLAKAARVRDLLRSRNAQHSREVRRWRRLPARWCARPCPRLAHGSHHTTTGQTQNQEARDRS